MIPTVIVDADAPFEPSTESKAIVYMLGVFRMVLEYSSGDQVELGIGLNSTDVVDFLRAYL